MHIYVAQLKVLLEPHANPANAAPMKKYMKGRYEYLGIKTPARKEVLKAFYHAHGLPPVKDINKIVSELWQLPYREYQYCAMEILEKVLKQLDITHLALMEQMVLEKSWWDTVDMIAARLVGPLLLRYPEKINAANKKWMRSNNMWLQRTAILFQLKYKQKTDTELLYNNIRACAPSNEFFLRKAIGWALREYSRTDAKAVRAFVASEPLSALSKKEALKRIERAG